MQRPIRSTTSTIDIYIKLAQYPILADRIRERMRQELFDRGIMSREEFEQEIELQAVESQKREGVYNPFKAEPFSIWEERKARIRNFHTDFHFAYNLPHALFEQIVDEVAQRRASGDRSELHFNPELAPWRMLFEQGEVYEALPPNELHEVRHHLEEIKVVLIRGMITDQLPLIGVAKQVLSIADLIDVYNRRIGAGKIGGKATGMLIAWKILQQTDPEHGADISSLVTIPESYYIGTDVMYEFRERNGLEDSMNQKYKPLDEIRAEYDEITAAHVAGKLPERIRDRLRGVLANLGSRPLIVRSSSLLEDNFGSAFAGKYDSYFCPNQGTPEENLNALTEAIKRIYASTLNPNALLYRRRHGLIDYDERMAILIQEVRGERFGDYFLPTLAGVAFSQNPFRWNPEIRREEGFLRMVWGLGTRAVDRVSSDYPRLVSLSHPRLRPETTARAIRQYSQHEVDVIDLKQNKMLTRRIDEMLSPNYPYLRQIASVDRDGYLRDIVSAIDATNSSDLVLTFDSVTRDQNFVRLMRTSLQRIERVYGSPVDIEFTVRVEATYPQPTYHLCLLQCRPLSQRPEGEQVKIPKDLASEAVLFSEHRLVPNGVVEGIRYIVFVDPDAYAQLPSSVEKLEVARAVGRINKALQSERFILMGPGRWGSANLDLGVRAGYADIYNTRILVEIATQRAGGGRPELSYGTHFFQDLVEAGIYALPLHLDDPRARFRWDYFRGAPNQLAALVPEDAALAATLRVIDVAADAPGRRLNVYMDSKNDEAIGALVDGEREPTDNGNGYSSLSMF